MYISSATGKIWGNPFVGLLPPFRNQYLCIDAEKALARLPTTLALSCVLIGYSAYVAFAGTGSSGLGPLVLFDALLRRLLVPSRLVGKAAFNREKRTFSRMLAFDFLLNFIAIACALCAFALSLPAGWALIASLFAVLTLAIGLLPLISRALSRTS